MLHEGLVFRPNPIQARMQKDTANRHPVCLGVNCMSLNRLKTCILKEYRPAPHFHQFYALLKSLLDLLLCCQKIHFLASLRFESRYLKTETLKCNPFSLRLLQCRPLSAEVCLAARNNCGTLAINSSKARISPRQPMLECEIRLH